VNDQNRPSEPAPRVPGREAGAKSTPTRVPAAAGGGALVAGAIDTVWVVAAVTLLVGGLVAYYWLGTSPMPLRVAAVVAGLALAVGAFAMSAYGRWVWQFVLGSRVELRKMVWPSMDETRKITLVVFAFVFLLGVFFWVVDWVLAWGTRHLLGTGV
jgi:preprotein translocase subunit SecE